jgi:UDP-2-acetamido-3-amino-2,3-dideoxy-glucuronate N-acetyltransferase
MVNNSPPSILSVPCFNNQSGSLFALQFNSPVPFVPRRVFFVTSALENMTRGGHAHRECSQVLIAINGETEVDVQSGRERLHFVLNSPTDALLVPPMNWVDYRMKSSTSVLLVLASHDYQESDYIKSLHEVLMPNSEGVTN